MRLSRTLILIVTVGTAILLGIVLWWRTTAAPEGSAKHSAGLPTTVLARGRIEPASKVRTLQGPAGSVIERLFVREGDVVQEGAVLAHTKARPALQAALAVEERRLAEAILTLDQIQAPAKPSDLETQQALIRQRDVEWRQARLDFERTRALVQRGVAAAELEQTRRSQMEMARHALDQAEWRLRSLQEFRGIDATVAATRVETQRALVARAQADLDRSEIRAPIAGTVLMILVREGEALGDEGLLQLGDLSQLVAVAEVGEASIARVRIGQRANIAGPTLAAPIQGRVSQINATVFRQRRASSDVLIGRDARVVEVEIVPDWPLPTVIWSEVTVRIDLPPS